MTDITSRPPDGAKPFLDLRIRLDSVHQIISISLNGVPIDMGTPESSELLAAQDCCGSTETAHPPAHDGCEGDSSAPALTGQSLAEVIERGKARGQDYLLIVLRNAVFTLFTVIAAQFFILHYSLDNDEAFIGRYGWWIFYLDVSVVSLVATVGYLRSYIYVNANHMIGMMIGMTIGMQVGTMIGGVLGATNGFFIGSIVGMSLGSLYGVISAWCCGPMAVMHGLMAGVMGGAMGAMVVVMMVPDHVLIFMPIFTTLNLMILIWFTYLFYRECVVAGCCPLKKPVDLPGMLGISLLTVGFLTALMVAGPKGPMVWKGPKRAPADGSTAANPFSMQDGAKSGQPDDKPAGEMACGAMMSQPEEPATDSK